MGVAHQAKLFGAGAWLRATGSRAAGKVLIDALGSEDENSRTLAGMFLVQGGRRAEPSLEEALRQRRHLPTVLTILGDIGDPSLEPDLTRFRNDPDPEVSRAAREALEILLAH